MAELTEADLTLSKILSQVYDGASVMVGYCGGVQCQLQERENKTISDVHCLNHQLHLVVVHTMSAKQAINEFVVVCNFFRKPTFALHCNGEKLKRLLEQR